MPTPGDVGTSFFLRKWESSVFSRLFASCLGLMLEVTALVGVSVSGVFAVP